MRVPLSDGWESQPFVTQVVPVWTRPHQNLFLVFHLQMAKFCAYPIDFPVVPKGAPRVRVVFHNHNTEAEVEGLAHTLYEWAQEMLDIEDGKVTSKIPAAARQAFSWTAETETEVKTSVVESTKTAEKSNGVTVEVLPVDTVE